MKETAVNKDNKTQKRPKWLKVVFLVKNVLLKTLKYTFLYFANRLEIGLECLKSFNPFLIGFFFLEWWFYFEGFWVYVWPYIIQFFLVLFLFLKLQITQLFT